MPRPRRQPSASHSSAARATRQRVAYAAPSASPSFARPRRAYDGHSTRRASEGVSLRRRRGGSVLDRLRRQPMRTGLIGLSIAGSAAPLAVARYAAMRTDPSHEQILSFGPSVPLSDASVGAAWRDAVEAAGGASAVGRETTIQKKLDRYQSLGLDRELAEQIYDIAVENEIDPETAFGLVRTESEFKDHATSRVGALGLTQLMPATARWLRPGVEEGDLRDSETNLSIGFKYLNDLIEKYEGDIRLALLAYNRGPGTVDRVVARGEDPDNGYADAVISGEGVH